MRALAAVIVLASSSVHAAPWVWQTRGKYLHDVAVANDGSVAAYAAGELLRFSPDGKVRHRRGFTPNAILTAIEFAPDGDLLVVGYFTRQLDLGDGKPLEADGHDGFVARYGRDGKLRWHVRVAATTFAHLRDVASAGDRVLVVGAHRGKATLGATTLDSKHEDRGLVLLLDAAGKLLAFEQVPAELAAACATANGFVVGGHDRDRKHPGFVRAFGKDGKARWSYAAATGQAAAIACRADGTSFVATYGEREPPKGNFSDDVAVLELDRAGQLVRTLPIVTGERDQPISITASASELVVTTRHNADGPVASRVTRFGAGGKVLATDMYKGDDTIWVRAAFRGGDVLLAGEVQSGATATVRGIKLVGPAVYVIAP